MIRRRASSTVVAITGSAGKTTTKEISATLLARRFTTFRNRGNLNNHIGLPLSLFELHTAPEFAVVELGMSGSGEIRHLVSIAEPQVRVWTNVGEAHLGFFSSVDEIALAKQEILEGATGDQIFVANADDPRVMARARRIRGAGDHVRRGGTSRRHGHRDSHARVRRHGGAPVAPWRRARDRDAPAGHRKSRQHRGGVGRGPGSGSRRRRHRRGRRWSRASAASRRGRAGRERHRGHRRRLQLEPVGARPVPCRRCRPRPAVMSRCSARCSNSAISASTTTPRAAGRRPTSGSPW